ncbi:MAG: recombination regulator RecX [Clostridiales bacterium]|nr:recombination regulator RecX [Clostridiales bacterium]
MSDTAEKAFRRAGYMLSRRSYSRQELFDKLCSKGITQNDAAYAVEKLSKLKLLNDEAYSRSVIENYVARGYGIHRVRQELLKRGIPYDMIDEQLSDIPSQTEKIRSLIEKKLPAKDPDRKQIKRVSDYLARRGFSFDEISPVLRQTISKDEFED